MRGEELVVLYIELKKGLARLIHSEFFEYTEVWTWIFKTNVGHISQLCRTTTLHTLFMKKSPISEIDSYEKNINVH